MGVNDRERDKRDERNRKSAENKARRFTNDRGSEPADWDMVDMAVLRSAIAAVSAMGGAIRLGYTRDGGAYAIGIYGDGEPFTVYVSPKEDINAELEGIRSTYAKG